MRDVALTMGAILGPDVRKAEARAGPCAVHGLVPREDFHGGIVAETLDHVTRRRHVTPAAAWHVHVITVSDRCASGDAVDLSGPLAAKILRDWLRRRREDRERKGRDESPTVTPAPETMSGGSALALKVEYPKP